jgi:hypothetical protein
MLPRIRRAAVAVAAAALLPATLAFAAQPPAAAPVEKANPAHMAKAGLGALDEAVGTEMPGERPAWLALPKSLPVPSSGSAWILGLGFLGVVVLRRVRAGASFQP